MEDPKAKPEILKAHLDRFKPTVQRYFPAAAARESRRCCDDPDRPCQRLPIRALRDATPVPRPDQ
jgi:hypothetical protein